MTGAEIEFIKDGTVPIFNKTRMDHEDLERR